MMMKGRLGQHHFLVSVGILTMVALTLFPRDALASGTRGAGKAARPQLSEYPMGDPVKQIRPFYHTTEEVRQEFENLASKCEGARLVFSEEDADDDEGGPSSIGVARVTAIGESSKKQKPRAMLVFGMHARELITVESALHFAQSLCDSSNEKAQQELERFDFILVPNANPVSRKVVEAGDYCLRVNEHGVDLNRNWGKEHRKEKGHVFDVDSEMNPGPSSFSEPETKVLKSLARREEPTIYLSVHTGAYLLGAPYGYTGLSQPENEGELEELLRPISEKFCNGECPYGTLAGVIGYDSPGCDIDYVSENLKTPYAFTWEIYTSPELKQLYKQKARARTEREEAEKNVDEYDNDNADDDDDAMAFFQTRRKANKSKTTNHHGTQQTTAGGGLMKRQQHRQKSAESAVDKEIARLHRIPQHARSPDLCWEQFNPSSKSDFDEVLNTWSGAYLELCNQVAQRSSS